jgi:hypothetical protein
LKDALDQYLEVTVTGGRPGATKWQRSSTCNGGACVEVAPLGDLIAIRDSAGHEGVILTSPGRCWRRFIADLKAGKVGAAG